MVLSNLYISNLSSHSRLGVTVWHANSSHGKPGVRKFRIIIKVRGDVPSIVFRNKESSRWRNLPPPPGFSKSSSVRHSLCTHAESTNRHHPRLRVWQNSPLPPPSPTTNWRRKRLGSMLSAPQRLCPCRPSCCTCLEAAFRFSAWELCSCS